jgi:antitoxin MazE
MYIMEADVRVSKWGNSLTVPLPKALVDQLRLKEGDQLNVVAAGTGVIEVETGEAQRQRRARPACRAQLDLARRL